MEILFKYATRSRPQWFVSTLLTYKALLSGLHKYKFVITCDNDDKSMNNQKMKSFMQRQGVTYSFGNHKSKVEAINANMEGLNFDILIVVSDDMTPVVRNFDDIIVKDMLKYFPSLDGALHYNDNSHCGEKVISLSIVGKTLYDRFGYIYHSSYKSVWCDNEFTNIVRQLKKVQWLDKCVIQHDWCKMGKDELYERNEALYSVDESVYKRRSQQAFPDALLDESQDILKS